MDEDKIIIGSLLLTIIVLLIININISSSQRPERVIEKTITSPVSLDGVCAPTPDCVCNQVRCKEPSLDYCIDLVQKVDNFKRRMPK